MNHCQNCGGQLYQMDDINGCLKCGELSELKKDEIYIMFKNNQVFAFISDDKLSSYRNERKKNNA